MQNKFKKHVPKYLFKVKKKRRLEGINETCGCKEKFSKGTSHKANNLAHSLFFLQKHIAYYLTV
jgi:hypothetical protein